MKPRLACLLTLLLVLFSLSHVEGGQDKIDSATDLQGKTIAAVLPPVPTKNVEASIANAIGGKPKEVQYFNRFSDCVLALKSGKADAVLSPAFIADYYMKRNSDLKTVAKELVKVNVVMGVRSEDVQLKDDLDKAIATLQENGFLKKLEDEQVTNLPVGNEPIAKSVPEIPGAKKIYVAVCGDYVPLDYIAANGRPAGYNVSLMNEIGRLLNINFEFVSIETQARFAALSSKKIDLIFCNIEGNTPGLQALKDKSWIATKPYFTSEVGGFLVKK